MKQVVRNIKIDKELDDWLTKLSKEHGIYKGIFLNKALRFIKKYKFEEIVMFDNEKVLTEFCKELTKKQTNRKARKAKVEVEEEAQEVEELIQEVKEESKPKEERKRLKL